MKSFAFHGVVERDDSPGYSLYFPDLPGCVTSGDSLAEVITNAGEALKLHLSGMLAEGEDIPAPSDPDDWVYDDDVNVHRVVLVGCDIHDKPLRVNVMLPSDLVAAIDKVTNNRSAYLAAAASEKLAREHG